MNSMSDIQEGGVVILFWSDNIASVSLYYKTNKYEKAPIGWVENTDENYWLYVGGVSYG